MVKIEDFCKRKTLIVGSITIFPKGQSFRAQHLGKMPEVQKIINVFTHLDIPLPFLKKILKDILKLFGAV